jgi:DNA-binding XRE family transcriptional regulator
MTEIVRVLRIIEYVGTREWVEKTLARTQPRIQVNPNCYIQSATLTSYPEVLPLSSQIKPSNLGSILKQTRISAGLNLKQAGRIIGVSDSTLSRIENGSSPTLQCYEKILNWVDIPRVR